MARKVQRTWYASAAAIWIVPLMLLGLVNGLSATHVAAEEMQVRSLVAKASPIPVGPIDTSHYVGRQLAHELARPLEFDAIVLPLITSSKVIAPRRVNEQQIALASYRDEHAQPKFFWKAYPWREQHDEFVTRFQAAKHESDRYELYRWCEQQELYDCAEFLLRRGLFDYQYRDTSDNYRWYLSKWKENGGHQRRSPFTFHANGARSVKVMVDTDHHHQSKHWSVWAWIWSCRGATICTKGLMWSRTTSPGDSGVCRLRRVVVAAVDHFPDHQIGYNAPADQGNYVQIDCGGGVYAYYGHLRQRGIYVRKGDKVQQGQMLGLIGSSGDTGVPHLHFTLMDGDGFSIRGRYQMEVWTTAGWRAYDGLDLEEGWHFRKCGSSTEDKFTTETRRTRRRRQEFLVVGG